MTGREAVAFAHEILATATPLYHRELNESMAAGVGEIMKEVLVDSRILSRTDLVDELDRRGLYSWIKGRFS